MTEYEALLADIARAHIEGIRRGYKIGYKDGHRDGHKDGERDAVEREKQRMNPAIAEGTRMGSSECARELESRKRKK